MHGLSDIDFDQFFKLQTTNYLLRGSGPKVIPVKTYKNSVWKYSFFERAPCYFNKLPADISSVKSLSLFKFKLKSVNYAQLKFQYK